MVKPPPAPPFVVIEAEFILEFLVIAFDSPAEFRECDEFGEMTFSGTVESQ